MKALRMMDRVDDSFNFGGWVHTVARNLCFDELRRRQRDLRVEGSDDDDDQFMAQLPSTSRSFDPVDVQESNETRRRVWAVAQKLPEKYRLVLTLRELQDLSYRQIARTLKISESAVETLLYRARLRFKAEYLAAEGAPEVTHEEAAPLLAPYLAGNLRRNQADSVRRHTPGSATESCGPSTAISPPARYAGSGFPSRPSTRCSSSASSTLVARTPAPRRRPASSAGIGRPCSTCWKTWLCSRACTGMACSPTS